MGLLTLELLVMVVGAMGKRKSTLPRSRPGSPPAPSGSGRADWIYGHHAVAAAVANPHRRCRRLVATEATAAELQAAADRAPISRPTIEVLERRDLEALLPPGAVHQGVAVSADPLAATDFADLLAAVPEEKAACLVVLDQATDPRNIGAVLRSAAAFGALAVVVQERHAPDATAVIAKAASGALETVPLVRVTNIARSLETAKRHGFWCTGLDAGAAATLAETAFSHRSALVLGSEGRGLRRLVLQRCDQLARIPIAVESLNVSAAAAIALYEVRRGNAS